MPPSATASTRTATARRRSMLAARAGGDSGTACPDDVAVARATALIEAAAVGTPTALPASAAVASQALLQFWRGAEANGACCGYFHISVGARIKAIACLAPPDGKSAKTRHTEALIFVNRAGNLLEGQIDRFRHQLFWLPHRRRHRFNELRLGHLYSRRSRQMLNSTPAGKDIGVLRPIEKRTA